MINELTKEQEAKIPEYLEIYLNIGLSTEPCDRVKAEAAITASYEYLKLPKPTFVWADSPFKGRIIAAQLAEGKMDVTKEEVAKQASMASYGSFESYWVSFYAFIAEQLPVKKDGLVDIVKDIVKNCGVYWTFEDIVVMTDKPFNISMKDKKLHNEEGLSLEYRDGTGIFAINGTIYPSLLDATIAGSADNET
jgi:hypothetical protein